MNAHASAGSVTSTVEIRVFKYRWIILMIFGLVSIINCMQLLQFTIIANIIIKFYSVDSTWVDMTGLIFFLCYILFFYPVTFLIEKYSLKFTVTTATALTLAGNSLKLLASSPDRFWLILLAQFLIAIGQVQIYSLPSHLATVWFGAEEVSTACAVVVLGMQLGAALGSVQSPFIVTSRDNGEVASQLFEMFLYQVIITGCVFVLVLVFFRSKPPLPPSQSQLNLIAGSGGTIDADADADASFVTHMKGVVANKNFWFIVFSLGLANAVWNSFGVSINTIYLNYFPNRESDVGIITLIALIAGGCIGSIVFGIVLDKTHQFKKISFALLVWSALTFVFVAVSVVERTRVGAYITIPIFGFFTAPVLVVGFEYLVEVTYPIPEACSSSTYNAAYYFLSIAATLFFEGLFDSIGYLWTFVVVFGILVTCAMFILLVDSDLKRRDANLKHRSGNSGHFGHGNTEVTIARL